MSESASSPACRACLRFGWSAVTLFLLLGMGLEFLHLVKAPFYVEAQLRRELWTLAHAHGTLLGLVNVAFAATAPLCLAAEAQRARAALALRIGSTLLPAGFFLGGIANAEGDPSLFVLLVPVGGVLVFIAAGMSARGALRKPSALPQAQTSTGRKASKGQGKGQAKGK